jgi:tripartite-type tricarboxylate transporter receptor subunit TctC
MDAWTRRALLRATMLSPLAGWLPAHAQASGSPGRLIVGYPAGGTLDATARQLAEAWRRQGRHYLVDNRSGAAGRIASSQLKRERPDASALLCTQTSALTIYPHVYTRLMYDPVADFVPISPVVAATCALAISSAVPAQVRTLDDYLAWLRVTPQAATYASPAAGSMAHFTGHQLSEAAKVKLQHVGYRGSAPAMQDLLGGQIPAYLGFVADFLPYLQQAKVRILAVTGDKRSRFLPGVATFAEQGFAQLRGIETYGLFAPPGTPEASVRAIHQAIVEASKDPALLAAFEQVGLETFTLAPREYVALIQRDRESWGPVVRASGFRSEE